MALDSSPVYMTNKNLFSQLKLETLNSNMNSDIFSGALTWDDYVVSMQINGELLRRKRGEFVLPAAERRRWASVELSAWHVLVFTEDWCQDSITALPPLLALAEVASFEIGVMRRSNELMLLRALTKNEWPPVPVFLFYDANWHEQGRFVAMPQDFRRMKHDPTEAIWLKEMYDEIWWETELEELGRIVPKAQGLPLLSNQKRSQVKHDI